MKLSARSSQRSRSGTLRHPKIDALRGKLWVESQMSLKLELDLQSRLDIDCASVDGHFVQVDGRVSGRLFSS